MKPSEKIKKIISLLPFKKYVWVILSLLLPAAILGFNFYNVSITNPVFDDIIKNLKANNITNYTWLISGQNSWEDLQNFLPNAKISGITVTVSLLPPSKCPPIDPSGSYSEPYRLNYVAWAQAIAKLSLRYSNLKEFTIQSLQQNINLGYLKQITIDSINVVVSSTNPRLNFNIIPSNLFYVDKFAKGNGNGSSWANAANKVATLNWSLIKAGDTIYVSGGTDSTVYTSMLEPKASGTMNKKIVITKGKDIDHNGKVIFNTGGATYALYSYGYNYIEYSYMTFENGAINGNVIGISHSDGIDIIHCEIYYPTSNGIAYEFSNNGRFLYDSVWSGHINLATGNDAFGLSDSGTVEIAYCSVICDNSNPTSHLDNVQGMNMFGIGNGGINKIHHNFFLQKSNSVNSNIDLETVKGYWEIYDNVIVCKATANYSRNIEFGNQADTAQPIYAKIYNNTLFGENGTYSIEANNTDSLEIVNNIIYKPNSVYAIMFEGNTNTGYNYIDYNRYYLTSTTNNQARDLGPGGSSSYTWAQWQALGYEAHGSTGLIQLVDTSGTNASDYAIVGNGAGVDDGKTLTLFKDDYNGVTRPQGTAWDIGAFEQK